MLQLLFFLSAPIEIYSVCAHSCRAWSSAIGSFDLSWGDGQRRISSGECLENYITNLIVWFGVRAEIAVFKPTWVMSALINNRHVGRQRWYETCSTSWMELAASVFRSSGWWTPAAFCRVDAGLHIFIASAAVNQCRKNQFSLRLLVFSHISCSSFLPFLWHLENWKARSPWLTCINMQVNSARYMIGT